MSRLKFRLVSTMGCVLTWGMAPLRAQQGLQTRPNELVVAKLVYVEPMPQNLDQWIIEDLRVWGKYKRTVNPEGVDLVIKADVRQRETEYTMRGGIPSPRREKAGGVHLPEQ